MFEDMIDVKVEELTQGAEAVLTHCGVTGKCAAHMDYGLPIKCVGLLTFCCDHSWKNTLAIGESHGPGQQDR